MNLEIMIVMFVWLQVALTVYKRPMTISLVSDGIFLAAPTTFQSSFNNMNLTRTATYAEISVLSGSAATERTHGSRKMLT